MTRPSRQSGKTGGSSGGRGAYGGSGGSPLTVPFLLGRGDRRLGELLERLHLPLRPLLPNGWHRPPPIPDDQLDGFRVPEDGVALEARCEPELRIVALRADA